MASEGSGTWIEKELGFDTRLVHDGISPDPATGAIITPIVQATTFVQPSIAGYMSTGYSYSRTCNPTVKVLEAKVAKLENAAGAACFSTGMAATVAVFTAFLKSGDHCILTDCSYGGTNRCARVMMTDMGVTFSYVDMKDPANVEAAIKENTKLIYSESPANPTLSLCDVAAISAIAKKHKVMHVCDATFATPLMMKPIDMGADMTLHSMTKFYDGHNMCVGGCVASATKEIDDKLHFYMNIHGNIMSPQVAFYMLQTCKTMGLRFRQQCATAMKVATFLEAHPKVDSVNYPGLASFGQKALADKQHLNGLHGSMLSFEVKGGTEAGRKLMDTVQRPWTLCENLGAVESIITCPAVMTHANMLKEDRLKVGITDGFVRVSCGIEDSDDLIAAMGKALDNL
jgi:cystathionine gamma-lyase